MCIYNIVLQTWLLKIKKPQYVLTFAYSLDCHFFLFAKVKPTILLHQRVFHEMNITKWVAFHLVKTLHLDGPFKWTRAPVGVGYEIYAQPPSQPQTAHNPIYTPFVGLPQLYEAVLCATPVIILSRSRVSDGGYLPEVQRRKVIQCVDLWSRTYLKMIYFLGFCKSILKK